MVRGRSGKRTRHHLHDQLHTHPALDLERQPQRPSGRHRHGQRGLRLPLPRRPRQPHGLGHPPTRQHQLGQRPHQPRHVHVLQPQNFSVVVCGGCHNVSSTSPSTTSSKASSSSASPPTSTRRISAGNGRRSAGPGGSSQPRAAAASRPWRTPAWTGSRPATTTTTASRTAPSSTAVSWTPTSSIATESIT